MAIQEKRGVMHAVYICQGPEMEAVVDEPDGERRWCFACRERVDFRFIVEASKEPSYWPPFTSIQCVHGHIDGDLFPGRAREWSE